MVGGAAAGTKLRVEFVCAATAGAAKVEPADGGPPPDTSCDMGVDTNSGAGPTPVTSCGVGVNADSGADLGVVAPPTIDKRPTARSGGPGVFKGGGALLASAVTLSSIGVVVIFAVGSGGLGCPLPLSFSCQ